MSVFLEPRPVTANLLVLEPLAGAAKGTKTGPFADAAMQLWQAGLVPVPCGGKTDKSPLIRWRKWRGPPGLETISYFIGHCGSKNVGILTGLSGVTVVDCDHPDVVPEMIRRCGDTPLKIRTPRGGAHLWYRSNGERCAHLRGQGLPVDIKGIGGYVVVPPSVRRVGQHAGKAYEILEGSWEDIPRLPKIRPGALDYGTAPDSETTCAAEIAHGQVLEGERNDTLFKSLLRHARHCDDLDSLMDKARTINGDNLPPLADDEVVRAATSAWDYECKNKNWVGTEQRIQFKKSEILAIGSHSDALRLLAQLRLSHPVRGVPFCIVPKAMARERVIPGWAHGRYRSSLRVLLSLGLLRLVHKGGRGTRDPFLYAFT